MADGDESAKMPPLLTYAFQANRWGALPEAGGLRDQPAGWLTKMGYLHSLYQAWQAYYNSASPQKWAENNPGAWDLLAEAKVMYREWQRKR